MTGGSQVGRLGRLALGSFLNRARRPVYALTLLAAVGLGYLAVPEVQSHWTVLDLAGFRGVYNSAFVGTATALTGTLWLTLGGFYVIRDAIGRDEATGVGELLAVTSLRTPTYLAAKFTGDLLVLGSMAGVLAFTALVLQWARGESRTLEPVALLLPFFVLTLPMLIVTASLAIVFDTVPRLRGGLGNVVWFVLALIIAIGGQSSSAPLGGLGVQPVFASFRTAIADHSKAASGNGFRPDSEFSFGLTYRDSPFQTFDWPGFEPTAGFLANRLLVILLAIALSLVPALWFARFDPARSIRRTVRDESPPTSHSGARVVVGGLAAGEFRILVQGVSRWWWLAAIGLTVVGAVAPLSALPALLLPIWVWPVLIWSRLGSQQIEHDVEGMLRAYPRARHRVVAQWCAGVVLTAFLASGPAVRMVLGGDGPGLAALLGGVLVVPSAALLLGLISRSHRLFQALYLPVWFLVVNGVSGVDYLGAVRVHGRPAGPPAGLIVGLALGMMVTAVVVDAARDGAFTRIWPARQFWSTRRPPEREELGVEG